jgi:hypothetical protein
VAWPPIPARPAVAVPATPVSGILGVNTHFASRSQRISAIPAQSRLVVSTQTRWVREDFHWYRIQRTADVYDWTFTDTAVDALKNNNIEILGVLGHPPGWATLTPHDDPYDNSFAAPDPVLFAQWAAQTVARYRSTIRYWQIWNEPDNPHFWHPAPDPRAYAALVHATAVALAQVAPEVQIVAAGVNPFAPGFLAAAASVGLWNDVDILAIHPYVNPTDPRYAGLADAVHYLAPLLHRYGPKPIWVTEVGWGSALSDRDPPGAMTPALQARALAMAVPILWASGISHVFWYSWKDELHNSYGLYAWGTGPDDMSIPKPAVAVVRALQSHQELTAPSANGTLILDFEGTHHVWVRGDEHTGVLFHTQRRATHGTTAGAIRYAFPPSGNQYVVFRRWHHAPLPIGTQRLCLNIWGDNTSTLIKVWLRGSTGARVQLTLGLSGPTGWRTICAPLPSRFADWDLIDPGDGILHQPATFEALVLDDAPDGVGSAGTIFFDELRAFSE